MIQADILCEYCMYMPMMETFPSPYSIFIVCRLNDVLPDIKLLLQGFTCHDLAVIYSARVYTMLLI